MDDFNSLYELLEQGIYLSKNDLSKKNSKMNFVTIIIF